jgi:hypothetical protein
LGLTHFKIIKEKEINDKSSYSQVVTKNSSLLFSIEQWELTRRLKNSGLTKEQLCQAFDDLDKMDKELGNLYNLPLTSSHSILQNSNHSNHSNAQFPINMQNFQSFLNKNKSQQQNNLPSGSNNLTSNSSVSNDVCNGSSSASGIINSYFANMIDPEIENREIENYRRYYSSFYLLFDKNDNHVFSFKAKEKWQFTMKSLFLFTNMI